jgi:putative tricarboxylic transport membrane protein
MLDFQIVMQALTYIHPSDLLYITGGVLTGIVLAAIPGLSGSIGIAILLPFTYLFPPITSLATLGGLYAGAMYGGSISAILLNIPGCGAAVATAFDGFPLAQKGRAADALYASALASFAGGIVGVIALTFMIQPLSRLSLKFGPVEFFWLAVLGISTLASLTAKNIIKGVMAGLMGIFLSLVGLDPLTGTDRFSFNIPQLTSGVPIIPIIIAMFAVPQLLKYLEQQDMSIGPYVPRPGIGREVIAAMFRRMKVLLIKSSVIGTIVGIIPGAGGYVASLVAYTEAKGSSKEPEAFGYGNLDGVVAAESANSATAGGALVPTLTFGIPGSNITAVLIGALLLHGFEPGPDLFVTQGPLVVAFILTLYFSYIVMLVYGLIGPKYFSYFLKIKSNYVISSFLVVCVIGSYAIRSNMMDVYLMLVLGLLGYLIQKMEFPLAPIVLGLILGPLAEKGLRHGITIGEAKGSLLAFFFLRPISIVLIVITILFILFPVFQTYRSRRVARRSPESAGREESGPVLRTRILIDVIAGGIIIILSSIGLANLGEYSPDARIFPIFIFTLFIILSAMLIVFNLKRERWAATAEGRWAELPLVPWGKYLLISVLYIIYVAVIQSVGFVISSFVFILILVYLTDTQRHRPGKHLAVFVRYVSFALITTAIIYILFIRVLRLSLPMNFLDLIFG